MARIAVFDPFSGASGDMILGALVDVGVPLVAIEEATAQLGIAKVRISAEAAVSGAVRGTRVSVESDKEQPSRDWRSIRLLLQESELDPPVREAAVAVFGALAAAEAEAHGEPIDDVHFHEVGAVDAIVDVVGACVGLHWLGIEQIVSYSVAVGSGWVRSAHGLLPIPAPATANLLTQTSAPVRPDPVAGTTPGELLTPTGAAILGTLADWSVPAFTPDRHGYGFGSRELPWPNALRLWIGEALDADEEDTGTPEFLLETNIDDMNPQFFEPLSERLFAAGALDVWLTPATMKKGRPATVVSTIVPANRRDVVERTLIVESTTLGVRATPISRTRAARRFETVATRWGDVRLKLRGWEGRVIGVMPEYEDCLRLSRESGAPIREIWAEANRLGEVFSGQRWLTPSPAEL
ncbi:MAG: nickel pincer cofactor biosynthesis protein LarC [Chloroflexia bacterium]|nr:nickel pincer cofactor biosynthesis protein LarC [Chloroflexia bacterium]